MEHDDLKRMERDMRDLEKIVYRLTESQQITTSNIDKLSTDIKELLKNSQSIDLVRQELEDLKRRVTKMESSLSWGIKILIGAFLLGVFNVLVKGAV